MNETANDQKETSTKNDSRKFVPTIRYGYDEESDHPRQAPRLTSIYEPVPDDAITASPIYFIDLAEYIRQRLLTNPWKVNGASCVADELQNQCQEAGEVLYPLYIESDSFGEYPPGPLLDWFATFLSEELGCSLDECAVYFSGNRSLHVHAPYFIRGGLELERFKNTAAAFCEEQGAEFDVGIYSRKRQFRLPGVSHQKTGLPKIPIDPNWGHEAIIRKASTQSSTIPQTYSSVLKDVFAEKVLEDEEAPLTVDEFIRAYGGSDSLLSPSSTNTDIRVPLIEKGSLPDSDSERAQWNAYNAKEFSPYARAKDGERSVAVIEVKGGAFQREEVGTTRILIPAYFYAAQGCLGTEFTKYKEHAPLQLSQPDFDKWEFEAGENVVVIGGASRKSRLFSVSAETVEKAEERLHPERDNRSEMLAFLEEQGYDIGSGGTTTATTTADRGRSRQYEQVLPANDPQTEAAEFQRQAEQEGIQQLSHDERWRAACRLLDKYSWDPVWRWFQDQFGDEFKPEVTWRQLKSVVDTYPQDYTHIEVPPAP